MNKNYFIIILTLLLADCKSGMNCDVPSYKHERQNHLNLNAEAQRSLNIISKILDGSSVLTINNPIEGEPKIRVNTIFFNLNKNEPIFYIENIFYYDNYERKISHYFSFEIPLSELVPENIKVSEEDMPMYGRFASIEFTSNYNNPEAFLLKTINLKGTNPEVTQCEKRSYFNLDLNVEDAMELKVAFIDFLNNYKKKP